MKRIKKGDIVSRNSYQNDILFYVEKIIENNRNSKIAILKGITIRIEADAPIDDLEFVDETRVNKTITEFSKQFEFENYLKNNRIIGQYGKILHLDR
jgi:spore coat assembly protein